MHIAYVDANTGKTLVASVTPEQAAKAMRLAPGTWPAGEPEHVRLYCPQCGAGIEEWKKTEMLFRGKWVTRNPGHWRAGFHLSSLYSPVGWLSWAEIARRFEESASDPERRKAFRNTILGCRGKTTEKVRRLSSLTVSKRNTRLMCRPACCF